MYSIKKIIVTGDILRLNSFGRESQNINIRWLFNLIKPALEMCTSLPIEPVYKTDSKQCLATSLYSTNFVDKSLNGWISLYERTPSFRDLALIHEHFNECFVISFELPEFLRIALEQLNIPYVDFTIHPVRFMDDILFGLRSNISDISASLTKWTVSNAEIKISAGLAMSMLSRLPSIPECKDAENVGLFCSQTNDDKVLIKNGRLLEAEDFMQDFEQMTKKHSLVLVKPHPSAANNPINIALTRLFPNTILVNENFYRLIVQDAVSHVYSITSSTSIEAAYFGKKGRHFSQYPYAFSDVSAIGGNFLTIKGNIYTPKFWESIFNNLNLVSKEVPDINLPDSRSRIRRSLRCFWGADIFENFTF